MYNIPKFSSAGLRDGLDEGDAAHARVRGAAGRRRPLGDEAAGDQHLHAFR